MADFKVVESVDLSDKYNKRYIVVDAETGVVLDDAQGYGYKTRQKAYAGYGYKTRDKSKDKEKEAKRKHIQKWMKENKDFVRLMDRIAFEIAKGSWALMTNLMRNLYRKCLRFEKVVKIEGYKAARSLANCWSCLRRL